MMSAFSLTSCGFLSEGLTKNQAATTSYISGKKSAKPALNVEGVWYSPEWGIVVLDQQPDGTLTGIFQDYYTVNGIVSGKNIYIALLDDEWTEYTVELTRKNREILTGFYSPDIPFSAETKIPFTLKRITL